MDRIIRIERVPPGAADQVQAVLTASSLMPLKLDDDATISLAAFESGDANPGSSQGSGDQVIGCAAVEIYGKDGLLRSVAVRPDRRGQHLGQYLVAAAEEEAAAGGIAGLYLLTETAESFFAALGYQVVERSEVPAAVLASDQFAKLCPSSAVAMHRDLNSED